MSNSFIKKIILPEEFEKVIDDISSISIEDDEKNAHIFNLKHDWDLIKTSLGHDSLLLWSIHVWAHFNGEKWDGIFIGIIRYSEKFGKKMMDEFLWYSKKSNSGLKLYKLASNFAEMHEVEFETITVMEKSPQKEKLKNFLIRRGFQKDSECFVRKINNSID